MALCVLEGFEGYGSASGADLRTELRSMWSAPTAGTDWFSLVDGFQFGKAMQWDDDETSFGLYFPVASTSTTVMGFTYNRFSSYYYSERDLIDFRQGSSVQASLTIDGFGILRAYRGSGTLLATSTSRVPFGTWCSIKIKLVVHNSTGSFQVQINDTDVINETNVDTQDDTDSYITQVAWNPVRGAAVDNLYIYNDVGGAPTLQDTVVIENLEPTADDTSDWTPSAGIDHYDLVDNTTIDDATYVSSTTITEVDLWSYANISEVDSDILTVAQKTRVTTDDVGIRTLNVLCESDVTFDENSFALASAGQFENFLQYYEEDPNTSAAWEIADLNAANFGVKVGD